MHHLELGADIPVAYVPFLPELEQLVADSNLSDEDLCAVAAMAGLLERRGHRHDGALRRRDECRAALERFSPEPLRYAVQNILTADGMPYYEQRWRSLTAFDGLCAALEWAGLGERAALETQTVVARIAGSPSLWRPVAERAARMLASLPPTESCAHTLWRSLSSKPAVDSQHSPWSYERLVAIVEQQASRSSIGLQQHDARLWSSFGVAGSRPYRLFIHRDGGRGRPTYKGCGFELQLNAQGEGLRALSAAPAVAEVVHAGLLGLGAAGPYRQAVRVVPTADVASVEELIFTAIHLGFMEG